MVVGLWQLPKMLLPNHLLANKHHDPFNACTSQGALK